MRKATGYLVAPVRGKPTEEEAALVSREEKWENINTAKQIGWEIRRRFPDLDLRIPHEDEEFIEALLAEGVRTETLLRAMARVAASKDISLVYTGKIISSGMHLEIDAVEEAGKEMVFFPELTEKKEEEIAVAIHSILAGAVEEMAEK